MDTVATPETIRTCTDVAEYTGAILAGIITIAQLTDEVGPRIRSAYPEVPYAPLFTRQDLTIPD